MKIIGIETTKYSAVIRAVLDYYPAATVFNDGLRESRHPDQWCTNRYLENTPNFLIAQDEKEILSFHDHPREMMAPIDILPLIKELYARRLLRFRILEEAYLTKRNSRIAWLLSWLKRTLSQMH